MNEEEKYIKKLEEKKQILESLCLRCGQCCGSRDGDPCLFLEKDKQDKYFCGIYETRLGPKKTISGYSFNCIPIEKAIRESDSVPATCPYRQI